MKKLILITILFLSFLFTHKVQATVYYADFSTTTCNQNGLSTSTAFCSINQFANNARAAGDIIFVRRGVATTTGINDITFTTDGTLNSPITITADYDNLWNGFSTSSLTATPVFGTTTITVSASSTVAHNSWIYFGNDCAESYNSTSLNSCEFAYEVASTSAGYANTVLTLYLPYKGPSSGAGVSIRQMGANPIWALITSDFQWVMSADDYWYFKGIDVRSTDSACAITPADNRGNKMMDMILQGNGVTDCGLLATTKGIYVKKTRIFGQVNGLPSGGQSGVFLEDFLIDCNNVASSNAFGSPSNGATYILNNGKITRCTNDFVGSVSGSGTTYYVKNVKRTTTTNTLTGSATFIAYFEDNFGLVGVNSQTSNQISVDTKATTTMATSTNLRSGGGPTNEFVMPPTGTANTGISTRFFPHSFIKLFEYPIYANTTSKTYTVYFNSTTTKNFNLHPTASEWWIECEYYNSTYTDNAERYLKKSVSTFNASSTAWQAFSVTCQPTQSGILYLRGWYGHPNDGTSNWFYMDLSPVVS